MNTEHPGQDGFGLRDSKNPDGPKLVFDPRRWRAFVTATSKASACHELDRRRVRTGGHETDRRGPAVRRVRA